MKNSPREYKVVAVRECPSPETLVLCDEPEKAASYWHRHIETGSFFDPEKECFVVLLLNTRRRVKGHHVVSIGCLDSTVGHFREVFRTAIVAAASAVILMHQHPSGDPSASEADLRITRDLIRAGQLLKIDVLDHVIMGAGCHASLREQGYISL